MTNDSSLESSYALLSESAKKNLQICKIEFFPHNPIKKVKMFAKKFKNDKIYIFKKPLTMPFHDV